MYTCMYDAWMHDACIQLDCVRAETKLSEQCLLRGAAAAAAVAPPIENMSKFRYG